VEQEQVYPIHAILHEEDCHHYHHHHHHYLTESVEDESCSIKYNSFSSSRLQLLRLAMNGNRNSNFIEAAAGGSVVLSK